MEIIGAIPKTYITWGTPPVLANVHFVASQKDLLRRKAWAADSPESKVVDVDDEADDVENASGSIGALCEATKHYTAHYDSHEARNPLNFEGRDGCGRGNGKDRGSVELNGRKRDSWIMGEEHASTTLAMRHYAYTAHVLKHGDRAIYELYRSCFRSLQRAPTYYSHRNTSQ